MSTYVGRPDTLENSKYDVKYECLKQQDIIASGELHDPWLEVQGLETKNLNLQVTAIQYNTEGTFVFLSSQFKVYSYLLQLYIDSDVSAIDGTISYSIDGINFSEDTSLTFDETNFGTELNFLIQLPILPSSIYVKIDISAIEDGYYWINLLPSGRS